MCGQKSAIFGTLTKIFSMVVLALTLNNTCLAHDQIQNSVDAVLESVHRPSLEKVKSLIEPLLTDIAILEWHQNRNVGYSDRIRELVQNPQQILNVMKDFEKAYPGAKWAFLGRDSVFVADVFEAVYREIGQDDRIVRLEASGNTIENATDEELFKFLVSNGLSTSPTAKVKPFVIIDSSHFNYSGPNSMSQSRRLLRAAYKGMVGLGFNPEQLIDNLAFVNIRSDYNSKNLVNKTNLHEYFDFQELTVGPNGPNDILTVPISTTLTYGDLWHSTFEKLYEGEDGIWRGRPGTLVSKEKRQFLFNEMKDVLRWARDNRNLWQQLIPLINPIRKERTSRTDREKYLLWKESSKKINDSIVKANGLIKYLGFTLNLSEANQLLNIENLDRESKPLFLQAVGQHLDHLATVEASDKDVDAFKSNYRFNHDLILSFIEKRALVTKDWNSLVNLLNPADVYDFKTQTYTEMLGRLVQHVVSLRPSPQQWLKLFEKLGSRNVVKLPASQFLDHALEKSVNAQEMLELFDLQWSLDWGAGQVFEQVVVSHADKWVSLHPDQNQWKQLKSKKRSEAILRAFLQAGLKKVKTQKEFMDLMDFSSDLEYRAQMVFASKWNDHRDHFLELPMDLSQVQRMTSNACVPDDVLLAIFARTASQLQTFDELGSLLTSTKRVKDTYKLESGFKNIWAAESVRMQNLKPTLESGKKWLNEKTVSDKVRLEILKQIVPQSKDFETFKSITRRDILEYHEHQKLFDEWLADQWPLAWSFNPSMHQMSSMLSSCMTPNCVFSSLRISISKATKAEDIVLLLKTDVLWRLDSEQKGIIYRAAFEKWNQIPEASQNAEHSFGLIQKLDLNGNYRKMFVEVGFEIVSSYSKLKFLLKYSGEQFGSGYNEDLINGNKDKILKVLATLDNPSEVKFFLEQTKYQDWVVEELLNSSYLPIRMEVLDWLVVQKDNVGSQKRKIFETFVRRFTTVPISPKELDLFNSGNYNHVFYEWVVHQFVIADDLESLNKIWSQLDQVSNPKTEKMAIELKKEYFEKWLSMGTDFHAAFNWYRSRNQSWRYEFKQEMLSLATDKDSKIAIERLAPGFWRRMMGGIKRLFGKGDATLPAPQLESDSGHIKLGPKSCRDTLQF